MRHKISFHIIKMNQSRAEVNWNYEKQKLIQKYIQSKAEHEHCILHLKKKSREYDLLVSEKIRMEKHHADQMNNISSQLNSLKVEAVNLKIQYSKKQSENITLSNENRMLKARIAQLQANQWQSK